MLLFYYYLATLFETQLLGQNGKNQRRIANKRRNFLEKWQRIREIISPILFQVAQRGLSC